MPLYRAIFRMTVEVSTPCYARSKAEAEAWMRAQEARVLEEDAYLSHERQKGTMTFVECRPVTERPEDFPEESLCWGPREDAGVTVGDVLPRRLRRRR